jgi:hypothetical protein
MRKIVNARKVGRRSNSSVRAAAQLVYRGLLRVPREIRARLPQLGNLTILPIGRETLGIILTGRKPVRGEMPKMASNTSAPLEKAATEVRKRIDKRTAAWKERHGPAKIAPKNYKTDERVPVLYIEDPASRTTLAFDPDGVAKLLGASTTVGGRKI